MYDNLLKSLPKNIRYAVKSKKELKTGKSGYSEYVLKKAKWIEYNKYTVNFLILDIDIKYKYNSDLSEEENLKLIKKYYPYTSIDTILNYIKTETFLAIPTWILETDKGFQIAWQLKTPFPTNFKSKAYKYGLYILRNLALYLGADQNAVRLKGIWRNPLKHKYLYTNNKIELNELEIIPEIKSIPSKKEKRKNNKIKHRIMHIENESFWHEEITKRQIAKELAWKLYEGGEIISLSKGLRNNTLWYYGMILARYKEKNILQKLLTVNKITEAFLSDTEIENIYRSIIRYKKEGKLYISKKSKRYDTENPFQCGKGNYPTWSREEKRFYINNYRISKGIVKKSNLQKKIQRNKSIEKAIELYKYPTIKDIAKISGYTERYIRKIIQNTKYYNQINYFTKKDKLIKEIIQKNLLKVFSISMIKNKIQEYKINDKFINIFVNLYTKKDLIKVIKYKNYLKSNKSLYILTSGYALKKVLPLNKDNILCMFTFCSLKNIIIKYVLNINCGLIYKNNINNIFLKKSIGPP